MTSYRPMNRRLLLTTILVALCGCAGVSGARVPPPGGGLDALIDGGTGGPPPAGEAGLQIDIPREGAAAPTASSASFVLPSVTQPGFVAPTSAAEPPPVPNFTSTSLPAASVPPVVTPSFSSPVVAPPATSLPAGRIKTPDGGFKSLDGKSSQRKSPRDAVAALPPPPYADGPLHVRGQQPYQIPPNPYGSEVQPIQYQQPVYPGPGQANSGFGQPAPQYGQPVQPTQPYGQPQYGQPQFGQPSVGQPGVAQPGVTNTLPPPAGYGQAPPAYTPQPQQPFMQPPTGNGVMPYIFPWFNPQSAVDPNANYMNSRPTPLDVVVEETRTGRFMFGVGVNSDAGVTGQVTIDERNFDIFNPPTSFDDFANGTAWRGRGQGFRIEAQPGTQVQRYVVSFTEPYLMNLPVSMSLSGFYYDRGFTDWAETRVGGRLGLGYRLTPDLSIAGSLRAEDVNIYSPRVLGVPSLDAVLGHNDIYSARASLTHDTRDIPFAPTEGHLIDVAFEQAFGEFDFARFDAEYSQYFMLKERPDGSGRHTLALSFKGGVTGSDTPIFENYFAGGFSTLRGFAFRGASPVESTVVVGGRLKLLGSAEYFFPLTADDMVKGVVFCDFGTIERDLKVDTDNFRVAPGFGFRVSVPALGPAPLAFDFAFPIAYADTDSRQVFSFFVGLARQ